LSELRGCTIATKVPAVLWALRFAALAGFVANTKLNRLLIASGAYLAGLGNERSLLDRILYSNMGATSAMRWLFFVQGDGADRQVNWRQEPNNLRALMIAIFLKHL
jgi:hypothetical protein